MHSYLRQATASQSRSIGPFCDDTDFKTAETALTIANTDIKLMINGAASANKNSGGGTHRANGVYGITFDATDTATVGEIFVSIVVSGALPVFATFVVVEEAVYDALFAASAAGFGTAQTGDCFARLGAPAGASVSADVAAVKTDTAAILVDTGTTLDARIPAALVSGRMDCSVGAMAANVMTAAAAAADLTTELQSGLATAASIAALNNLSSAQVNAECDTAISDAALATAANLATVAGYVDTEVAAILAAVDTEVAAIKAVTDLLPDAGALTSLATAVNLATVDAVVDAIKAKTDSLTFTTAGIVDANVEQINTVTITGNGQVGTEFGVA